MEFVGSQPASQPASQPLGPVEGFSEWEGVGYHSWQL